MALMDFIKKQFIDVIQWTEDGDGTLAWRFPMAGMEIQKVVFDMADPCCLRLIPVNSILENPIVPQMGGRAGPCGPCTASAARQLLRQERNLWSSLPSPVSAPPSFCSSPPPSLGMGPGLHSLLPEYIH